MPQVTANNIAIEYEEFGNANDPCVLLVMGLGTQLTAWPDSLCHGLVDKGYRVIRYDNRDVGLSMKFDHAKVPSLPKVLIMRALRLPVRVPYSLDDMANDGMGLLDALGIDQAHVVGASMGGMIVQLMAANHSNRVLSMTSIMSTTGHRSLPRAEPEAMKALTLQPDDPTNMASVHARNVKVRRAMESPAYRESDAALDKRVAAALERGGYYPDGAGRQLAAIVAANDRRTLLKSVRQPALVIHGEDDPLVKLACGIDTAKYLANGELVTFSGMGHDVPEPLMPKWVDLIDATAKRA